MIIKFPRTLPFPVIITKLLKAPADDVERLQPLLYYTYRAKVTEMPEFGVEETVEREFTEQFDAPEEGTFVRWLVSVGAQVESSSVGICEVEEVCSHDVQFAGLKDYNSGPERAMIQIAHDNTGLKVSENEAKRLEETSKRRLLRDRKLSLVVDLDQTIIHATVDPTVGEWKDDPYCINHESVKDVQAFKLDEDISGGRGTWYYVKMRPGLQQFLKAIAQLYELHIYTMGTRAYAMCVKKIVDPDGTIFGERVLSRDESGSMTQKSLQRLFPVDTKMVVIIDDRGDVWKWCDNLVKVKPYDFFVGIGDINSMFLPKRQDFPPTSVPGVTPTTSTETVPPALESVPIEKKEEIEEELAEEMAETEAFSEATAVAAPPISTLDALVTMSGSDNRELITDQAEQLEKAIEAQKEQRPLAKMQEEQDKLDEKAAEQGHMADSSNDTASEGGTQKHSVLHDNDQELFHLQKHLTAIHHNFFEVYDRDKKIGKDRVSQLKDSKRNPRKRSAPDDPDGLDLSAVPDVARIMPTMKQETFKGVVLVFSGVIPLNADLRFADIAIWARSFGAVVTDVITPRVTHVVAARQRTAKVRQAARFPQIKIVTLEWLTDSISHWQREPEDNYLVVVHESDRNPAASPNGDKNDPYVLNMLSSEDEDSEDASDDEDDEDYDSEFMSSQPADPVDDHLDMSNVGWKDVDEEFAEFFGDEDFDSDTESVRSGRSTRSERTDVDLAKRKRAELSDADDPDADGSELPSSQESIESATVGEGSRLAKRQKIARERAEEGSALKVVEGADANKEEDQDELDARSLEEDLERGLLEMDDEEEVEAEKKAADGAT
ncbi:hypothetical protein EX30DRAFT_368675 [Ascodesmis nigricans]|uniref:RNA polymerase II subunit A C-terminal domain phosphatase n=1 Tax=Ascodesmis nigricans TaxID=341454 RepID=A0A4S2N8P2_9PEZI|nr:hypothetical protein EX30DRAFT_368675 [Ascodesmis nigricans]